MACDSEKQFRQVISETIDEAARNIILANRDDAVDLLKAQQTFSLMAHGAHLVWSAECWRWDSIAAFERAEKTLRNECCETGSMYHMAILAAIGDCQTALRTFGCI